MGFYLNNAGPFTMYQSESIKPYFVDKTMILSELCPLAEEGNNLICVTRPRRFGKTVMANMIGAFFGRAQDSSSIFSTLNIGKTQEYKKFLNKYNVVYISFNELPRKCGSYDDYIERIEDGLIRDLQEAYPN